MAVTVHKLDKIVIGGWSAAIDQVTNFRQSMQITSRITHPSGHPLPMFAGGEFQLPRITFTTPQIDVVLANCGVTGYGSGTDSILYYKLATPTGSDARNSTTHKIFTVSQVYVYFDNLTLPDRGQATVDVTIVPVWDGTNEPIVPSGSAALASTLTAGNEYRLGPASANDSAIGGMQSINLRINHQILEVTQAGEGWATFVGCDRVQPIVTCQTAEAIAISGFGFDGSALDGDDGFEFFARHVDAALTAETHVYFQATDGRILPEESGIDSTTGLVADSFRVECISPDDSTSPIIWDTTAAIVATPP